MVVRSARLTHFLLLFAACGGEPNGGVDAPTSAACMEATTYQNLANIEDKIFRGSCTFSSCHAGGVTPAGMMDLRADMAFADLVNVPSRVHPGLMIVVPGAPERSTLMLYMGAVEPGDFNPVTQIDTTVGTMPQGQGLLCPEKRDAVKRWIMAGAAND